MRLATPVLVAVENACPRVLSTTSRVVPPWVAGDAVGVEVRDLLPLPDKRSGVDSAGQLDVATSAPPAATWGLLSRYANDPTEDGMSVYRVIDVIGTSPNSWEEAAKEAVTTAAGSVRDLRVAEVTKQDVAIGDAGELIYRVKLQLSFKYESQ
jgi:hypothetical protein